MTMPDSILASVQLLMDILHAAFRWQEVRLRKEAQKEAEKLQAEVAPLKQHIAVLESTCADLRAAAAVQRQGSMQGQPTPPTAHPQQLQQLQAALAQRDTELGALRQQVADLQRRASLASSSVGGSRGHGKDDPSADTALQLVVLKERVEALEAENDDLKAELNAFDPQVSQTTDFLGCSPC